METAPNIELNEQIIFNRPNSLAICRVIEVREKAIRVDYAIEPVHPSFHGNGIIVYSYTCFIPKSVIIAQPDGYGITVKNWFANKFTGGVRIKRYYMENDKKITV